MAHRWRCLSLTISMVIFLRNVLIDDESPVLHNKYLRICDELNEFIPDYIYECLMCSIISQTRLVDQNVIASFPSVSLLRSAGMSTNRTVSNTMNGHI